MYRSLQCAEEQQYELYKEKYKDFEHIEPARKIYSQTTLAICDLTPRENKIYIYYYILEMVVKAKYKEYDE